MVAGIQKKIVVLLAATPILILLVHAGLSRLGMLFGLRPSNQWVAILSAAVGNVPVGIVCASLLLLEEGLSVSASVFSVVYVFVVYNLLGYTYFHMLNMSETARRIRILDELRSSGPITVDRLEARYGSLRMVHVRVQRLIELWQVERRGDRLFIRGGFLLIGARLIGLWRRLLRL